MALLVMPGSVSVSGGELPAAVKVTTVILLAVAVVGPFLVADSQNPAQLFHQW